MDESEGNKWSTEVRWAKCSEPYKTQLERLASRWIKGSLPNERLAVELWNLTSHLRVFEGMTSQGGLRPPVPDRDVRSQIELLADAMLLATKHPSSKPKERRKLLETSVEHFRIMEDGPRR